MSHCTIRPTFVCPNCGGTNWGTGGDYGFCHGGVPDPKNPKIRSGACGFWWLRSEDYLVMKRGPLERAKPVVTAQARPR